MSEFDLTTALKAATWVPKTMRDNAARLLPTTSSAAHELLAFALATRSTEAVGFWRTLQREHLPRDVHHRLSPAMQRHLVTVAGARTVRPMKLAQAIGAMLSAAGPVAVDVAERALLALGQGVSLADAHGIYVSAARKAPAHAQPQTPPHLGGPVPELSVFETVELAISLATAATAKRPDAECEALIARATKVLALVRAGQATTVSAAERVVPPTSKAKGPAFTLARAALKEAWTTDHVSGRGTSIKSGVAAGLELGDPAWWLAQVDEALMTCDARTAFERRGQNTSSRLTRCVWRAGYDTSKFWLGHLESGRYALLSKLGRAWSSTEGDLDTVTATIPDAWFARAMPVIQGRR
jgi:hypothetical protein